MDIADIYETLIAYYINLLIIQYSGNQPKASATIKLMAAELLASAIYFQLLNAYNLIAQPSDTWDSGETWDEGADWDAMVTGLAEGAQLDVLGKYVGVTRFYPGLDLENYFSLITYDEVNALPASPPRFGFETYATFDQDNNYNGTLTYSDIVTIENALSDADFLTMIRLAILCNNMNYSYGNIDNALYQIFGTMLRAESSGNMVMWFFINGPLSALINAVIFQNLLPVPMGVGSGTVTNVTGPIFGMTDYSAAQSPFAFGFSTYANYGSLPGDTLTYSQLSHIPQA